MSAPGQTSAHSPRGFAAIGVAAALTPLNSTMVAVALPAISQDFEAAPANVTVFVVTVYLIATIVFQMPAGAVADCLGYGRTLSLGRGLFMAGAASATLAPSLAFVIIGRLLMAAGGALMLPTAMALLRVLVPEAKRPRAFGAMGAMMGGAAALGPALGALLIARTSWRVLFLVNLPLVALSWWLQPTGFAATASPGSRAKPFDWAGSLLLGAALVLAVVATRVAAPWAYAAAVGGVGFFFALVRQARQVAAPVLDFTLFRKRAFVAGASVIALQNLAMYALLVQVPFLFAGSGLSRASFGVVVIAMTATMALSSPIGGRLAERIGSRVTVLMGGVTGALGVLSLVPLSSMVRAGNTTSPFQVAMPLLAVGLGLGLSTGPSQAAALSAIEPHRSAMASAAISTMRYLGAVVGTAILGLALAGGGDTITAQQRALVYFAAAFAVSAVMALRLGASRS